MMAISSPKGSGVGSPKAPTLPLPSPKAPPGYPDLYGKRREISRLHMLEREISFLEEELKSSEGFQPASRCCKEIDDFVMAKADPLLPTKKKKSRSSRFWKWLCCTPCSTLCSCLCCCCCCEPRCCDGCSKHLSLPSCSCCQHLRQCSCCKCVTPKSNCCRGSNSGCCKGSCGCQNCCIPPSCKCLSCCSCKCSCSCTCPTCPKLPQSCCCIKSCWSPCCCC
ncbi:hypothetical protein PIB30_117011 [Stylosanthes scabra]|uniref:G protein gamma domain-containing protein n=1 Tax=Stylosanthes scabra TaxID=79078 RepID=A0ABU6VB79_9FABA|nr:hypothetical protein [Stylosanthes scabra]